MSRLVIVGLLAAGCAARPVKGFTTIPKDTAAECRNICRDLGLELSAVVVVASEVGCVCEVQPGASRPAGASAASGGAVIVVQRQAAAQQQQQAAAHK